MKKLLLIFWLVIFCVTLFADNDIFWALDLPSDDGKALILNWNVAADSIHLQKADSLGMWVTIFSGQNQPASFTDSNLNPDTAYQYRLQYTHPQTGDSLSYTLQAQPKEQWFNLHKLSLLLFILVVSLAILYYIMAVKRGKDFYIRRISGLDSMDEAVGRATEKGKPILYVPGISDLDDMQTIASLTILSHLAHRVAEYDSQLIVPCKLSMVMSAAKEIVKEAYLKAGKPDSYKDDSVFYLTDDQFGYVAGIDGIMVREQPAANFFIGSFYAESLILAETGYSTGAIQTAGTAQAHQLPFFVVSCDYTLIGEELFAASAYLSRDPLQLGSLKGHDFGKLLVITTIILGVIAEIIGWHWFKAFFEGV
ncbi:MAG: hypothetical protein PHO32_01850 [Candidatus Cloacimonetes bacterium]|nr:hypothetical protein [Candidatus Cloacimonadota bacterium]